MKKTMKNKIAVIRKQKGFSQKQLADMVGIGNDWLCDIEKGKGTPSIQLLNKIAETLKCKVSDIFLD